MPRDWVYCWEGKGKKKSNLLLIIQGAFLLVAVPELTVLHTQSFPETKCNQVSSSSDLMAKSHLFFQSRIKHSGNCSYGQSLQIYFVIATQRSREEVADVYV